MARGLHYDPTMNLVTLLQSSVAVVALSLATATVGCAAPAGDTAPVLATTQAQALEACTPAVIVIRHAEDMDGKIGEQCVVGETSLIIPGGTQKIRQHCLTPAGDAHARLYSEHLASWIASKNLCPAGRVITQDPYTLSGGAWPSANPFETIRPFANAEQIPMTFVPPTTTFDAAMRRSLLTEPGRSVVVAWDKEGLAERTNPLLSEMSDAAFSFPNRDMVWVFSNMNATTAKFDLKEYKQFFQDSSGYFAKVTGSAFSSTNYYRFADGALKSKTAYSTDLVPSDMIFCGGSSCDGQGVTLSETTRR